MQNIRVIWPEVKSGALVLWAERGEGRFEGGWLKVKVMLSGRNQRRAPARGHLLSETQKVSSGPLNFRVEDGETRNS